MKLIKVILGVPICFVMAIIIMLITTLLWPIYFISALFGLCISKIFKIDITWYNDLIEFIFVCYGFGLMVLILPFELQ